jgi:hypothetical protein
MMLAPTSYQIPRRNRLDDTLSADRHEDWCFDHAMRGHQRAASRRTVAVGDDKGRVTRGSRGSRPSMMLGRR